MFSQEWFSDHIPWYCKYCLLIHGLRCSGTSKELNELTRHSCPVCVWCKGCILKTAPVKKSLFGSVLHSVHLHPLYAFPAVGGASSSLIIQQSQEELMRWGSLFRSCDF